VETRKFFRDGILTSEETRQVLGPEHLRNVAECIFVGFGVLRGMRDDRPDDYVQMSLATRAAMVHDSMVAHSLKVFRGMEPDVVVIDALGSKVVVFFDQVALRFKKLSDAFEPRNIQTRQQEEFSQHTLWPDHTNVTAGYRLDATGHEIRDTYVVCRYYGELLWRIELPYTAEDFVYAQRVPIVEPPSVQVRVKVPRLEKTGTEEK
jgi:hypothetical protein